MADLASLLHITALASHIQAARVLFSLRTPIDDAYGQHYQFLTVLTLFVSSTSFAFACLADMYRYFQPANAASSTLYRILVSLKRGLSSIAGPAELLVTILYAGLVSIRTDLVIPDWLRIPLLLDIGLHVLPAVFQLIDFFVFSPQWQITLPVALTIDSTLALSYWFWIEKCYKHNGFYPYPIFDEIGLGGRLAMFLMSAGLMATITMSLKYMHS